MEVRDCLAGIGSVVEHKPVAVGEAGQASHLGCLQEQMPEQSLVLGSGRAHGRHGPARDNENVCWGGGMDVVKRHNQIVLVNDFDRDFLVQMRSNRVLLIRQ